MRGFELVLEEIQPFKGLACYFDARISGTVDHREWSETGSWKLDFVEARDERGNWVVISGLHPLHKAVCRHIETGDARNRLLDKINETLAEEPGLRDYLMAAE